MYLSNKQIDRLNEHNQMLRKSGQKALRHDEVARFFGPERTLSYTFGPHKTKPAHTIGAQHDRAKAGKLGRRERIKPSRKGRLYYEWALGVRMYGGLDVMENQMRVIRA